MKKEILKTVLNLNHGFMGRVAVLFGRQIPTFRRDLLLLLQHIFYSEEGGKISSETIYETICHQVLKVHLNFRLIEKKMKNLKD